MAASLWRTVLHICSNRGSKIVASLKQVHYQFGCFQLDDRVLRCVGEKFAREVDTVVPVAVLPVRDWMDSDDTLVAAGHTRQEDPCDVGRRGNELWPAPHLDNMRAVRFATQPVTEAFLHAKIGFMFISKRIVAYLQLCLVLPVRKLADNSVERKVSLTNIFHLSFFIVVLCQRCSIACTQWGSRQCLQLRSNPTSLPACPAGDNQHWLAQI